MLARQSDGRFLGGMTRPAARRRDIEGGIQKAFATWCRYNLRDDVIAFSVPNENDGSPKMNSRLNAMGRLKGAADYAIIFRGRYHALEFKSPDGTLTEEQAAFWVQCKDQGAPYRVARSLDQAVAILNEWGIPHRDKGRAN